MHLLNCVCFGCCGLDANQKDMHWIGDRLTFLDLDHLLNQ